MKDIVLVTNILTPYRKKFYDDYYEACKNNGIRFHVFCMAETEPERNWYYQEYSSAHTTLMDGQTKYYFGIMTHDNPKVLDYIRKVNPDLILVGGSYMFLTLWRIVINKKKLNAPIIYWNESHKKSVNNYNALSLIIRHLIRKWFFKKIDGFWCGGQLAKEFVQDYATADAKYYFLPNLIDYKAYNVVANTLVKEKRLIRKSLGIVDDKTVFFCPARLTYVKGLHTFMDLIELAKNKTDAVILIAGDGDMEKELKEKAQSVNVDIRFLGYKEQNEVIELYKAADIFLMPSLSDPNPLTCIEALWCGLPLLVSKHVGNYPETIKQGENGYVFDYSSPNEAIKIIETIISSSGEWRQRAKLISLDIANKTYNQDVVIENSINELVRDWDKYGR